MSRTRSSSSPGVLAGGVSPFTPLQPAVDVSHIVSKPPSCTRSSSGSPTRNRSKRFSKSTRTSSSSTSIASVGEISSVYYWARVEPPSPILKVEGVNSTSLPIFFKYQSPSHSRPESDQDDEDGIFTRKSSKLSLRARLTADRGQKGITTTPGLSFAGETETEGEEQRNLPTSRIIPPSGPLIPPNAFGPLLFEFSRWLSIVPALFGVIHNIFGFFFLLPNARPCRADFFIATLWAILTGHQCLALTTGLLRRWRLYYTPLPTLIRLFGLQAVCWPATQITLNLLDAHQRPAICWAIIAATTCCSRSVQMWVTSNIIENEKSDYVSLRKWGGRKWDWARVGQNAVPLLLVYFLWAWMLVIRAERLGDC